MDGWKGPVVFVTLVDWNYHGAERGTREVRGLERFLGGVTEVDAKEMVPAACKMWMTNFFETYVRTYTNYIFRKHVVR